MAVPPAVQSLSPRTLSHLFHLLVPQMGALVRYVVFIVDVVVGTPLFHPWTIPSPVERPHSSSLRVLSRSPRPDFQYIFVDFSSRMKTVCG
jgi:hypothetical protein